MILSCAMPWKWRSEILDIFRGSFFCFFDSPEKIWVAAAEKTSLRFIKGWKEGFVGCGVSAGQGVIPAIIFSQSIHFCGSLMKNCLGGRILFLVEVHFVCLLGLWSVSSERIKQ